MTGERTGTLDALRSGLAAAGVTVESGVDLAPMTTLRVGGPAALFVRAADVEVLERVARVVAAVAPSPDDGEILVIGQGSNLLVADDGVEGLVVRLDPDGFSSIVIEPWGGPGGGRVVRAGAAVKLPVLARTSVAAGCGGLEWMVGVPGSVGGAVRMNAGGHGSDMAASLRRVRVVSLRRGTATWVDAAALDLAYRHSSVASSDVVVEAEFVCPPRERALGEAELAEIVRWRREHQPGGANCGSVFTNPPGDSAGRLIDAAGLKGTRVGGASVSEKHANFIQADPGARPSDVWALIDLVRRAVHARSGVVLHPEVRTAGRFEALTALATTPAAQSTEPPPPHTTRSQP